MHTRDERLALSPSLSLSTSLPSTNPSKFIHECSDAETQRPQTLLRTWLWQKQAARLQRVAVWTRCTSKQMGSEG